jgi:hypothetical protein
MYLRPVKNGPSVGSLVKTCDELSRNVKCGNRTFWANIGNVEGAISIWEIGSPASFGCLVIMGGGMIEVFRILSGEAFISDQPFFFE